MEPIDPRIWSYDNSHPIGCFEEMGEAMAHVLVTGRSWQMALIRRMPPPGKPLRADATVDVTTVRLVPGYGRGQVKFATKEDQQNFAKIMFEVD